MIFKVYMHPELPGVGLFGCVMSNRKLLTICFRNFQIRQKTLLYKSTMRMIPLYVVGGGGYLSKKR